VPQLDRHCVVDQFFRFVETPQASQRLRGFGAAYPRRVSVGSDTRSASVTACRKSRSAFAGSPLFW